MVPFNQTTSCNMIAYKTAEEEIEFYAGPALIKGNLHIPENAKAIVLITQGSGGSRFNPKTMSLARQMENLGYGTFLFDLLTKSEESDYSNRFNIELLTERMLNSTEWILRNPECRNCAVGYYATSIGAAAALKAAARLNKKVRVVVARSGRPDLAVPEITEVKAATKLIVGSLDDVVLDLNQKALQKLKCEKELSVVKNASNLFDEPESIAEAEKLAAAWFKKYL